MSKPSPHEIDRALCLLRGDDYTVPERKKVVFLNPKNCLAEAWNEFRLERGRRLSSEGQKAPPVRAVAIKVGGRTLYSLSDGNHRVIEAAERGKRVAAIVSEYTTANPAGHFIQNGILWREEGERASYVSDVGDDTAAALETLGVRVISQ